MSTTKIYAPNPDYSGTYTWGDGTVTDFHDGVAEVDQDLSPAVRGYLASNGYGIGKPAPSPADEPTTPPDPRDVSTDQVGSRLRDAAVDPRDDDFLPPINAGKEGDAGNPHGPNVVAPEIHASAGQAIAPGPVGRLEHDDDGTPVVVSDTDAQAAKETELAQRTRIDNEPVPQVVADMGEAPAPHTPDAGEPKGGAKREEWVDYARSQGAPEAELGELGTEGALSRDDLRAKYGS